MSAHTSVPEVGSPDPELKTSPIAQEVPGEPVCHFNDRSFANAAYVRSGAELLKCNYGVGLRQRGSDPDNP